MSKMLMLFVEGLNAIANRLGSVLLAPVGWIPGWLSATLIAMVSGFVMLLIFKHTSNQSAIHSARNQIKANLLALSLFQDDIRVGLRAQGRVLIHAVWLMLLAVVPMLILALPTCLLLGQMSLWYQVRPLAVGEQAVLTVHLSDKVDAVEFPAVRLLPIDAVSVVAGPVRVREKGIVCWNLRADQAGIHQITLEIAGTKCHKELAVGDGFLPVSIKRPSEAWEALLHPREQPFGAEVPAQSIDVNYPARQSWTTGSRTWLIYWFLASVVTALAVRPWLGVHF